MDLKARCLLSTPTPVEPVQDQVADAQPLAGRQLRGELQGVAIWAAQPVGGIDVLSRCVHVERA